MIRWLVIIKIMAVTVQMSVVSRKVKGYIEVQLLILFYMFKKYFEQSVQTSQGLVWKRHFAGCATGGHGSLWSHFAQSWRCGRRLYVRHRYPLRDELICGGQRSRSLQPHKTLFWQLKNAHTKYYKKSHIITSDRIKWCPYLKGYDHI